MDSWKQRLNAMKMGIDFGSISQRAIANGLTEVQVAALLAAIKQDLLNCHVPPRNDREPISMAGVELAKLFQQGQVTVYPTGSDVSQWTWQTIVY